VLAPMYAEIAPYDPAGTLRHEWLNSRGACTDPRRLHAIYDKLCACLEEGRMFE
jgi:hypothetical protein